jgi:hypothetical protein
MADPSDPSPRKRPKANGGTSRKKAGVATLYNPSKTPNTLTVEAGTMLERIHPDRFGPVQFNNSAGGNARFSPIHKSSGDIEPSIYAAETFSGAAMETAFHDVPIAGSPKNVQTKELEGLVHSTVEFTQDLVVADLSSKGLHKLGLEKSQVIETGKRDYPQTRTFAEHVLEQNPAVQGFSWMSRKDDTSRSYVFFESRVPAGALKHVGSSKSLLGDDDTFEKLQDVADEIDVNLTP